jgi:hypothetical protein
MAERVIRQIIDDIDKSEIAEGEGERIEFTFRGVAYQLDLSNANVAKLEKRVVRYRRLDKRCRRKTITTAQARG